MEYRIWEVDTQGDFCVLTTLKNVDKSYELTRGVSRAAGFPADASFAMDPEHPRDLVLADNLYNTDSIIVVSPALKEAIEAVKPPEVEFLPVTILNHKGRVASDEYQIVNPLAVVDCIDQDASQIEWNAIDPTLISSCFGLVLDPQNIDPQLVMFRLKHLPHVVLLQAELADGLLGQGFTGLDFVEIDEFEF